MKFAAVRGRGLPSPGKGRFFHGDDAACSSEFGGQDSKPALRGGFAARLHRDSKNLLKQQDRHTGPPHKRLRFNAILRHEGQNRHPRWQGPFARRVETGTIWHLGANPNFSDGN